MARHVWFKVPDRPVQFAPMADGVDSIRDLREKVVFEFFTREVQDQVKFYASPAAQRAKQPLDLDTKVDGLGADLQHPVLVEAPLMFPRIRVVMHGVRLEAPRLERNKLLDQVSASLLAYQKRFVLLAAPEGSGKTSILMLFEHHHAELNCVFVSFIWEKGSADEVMQQHGLDICGRKSTLSEDQEHVILIDDAQEKYEDRAFWKALITDSASWLPSNIRFIIAANHALHGESPTELRSIKTFWRSDFLLSDEESYGFLALPVVGLPEKMKDDKATLAQLMVRECGGLIGALRVGVNILEQEFLLNPTPSELELVLTFLSHRCRKNMGRCFGKPATPTNSKFRGFLAKCLTMAPAAVPLKRKLAKDDRRGIVDLMNPELSSKKLGKRCSFRRRSPRGFISIGLY